MLSKEDKMIYQYIMNTIINYSLTACIMRSSIHKEISFTLKNINFNLALF